MFEHLAYLAVLLLALGCLALVDYRYRLAFWYDLSRTIKTLLGCVTLFAAWDIAGIHLGIFHVGSDRFLSGIRLVPNFPLEELFFLAVLTYSALLLTRGSEKLWPRT